MDLSLIHGLSFASAYPFPVTEIAVRQTHISAVFLAGPFAYKIKKPVDLGFLDFSTLEKRRYYCEQEVRLNRRLAPAVYLGVVPVTRARTELRMEGDGPVVEWAVKMARLPDDATLKAGVERGDVGRALVEELARKIAAFHTKVETNPRIAAFGSSDVVAANVRENFDQSATLIGTTVAPAVLARLRELTEAALDRLRPLISARALRGMTRDTHGDLHLDHVYHFPERQPPDDLVIIDCIEFNERFRYADPVADMAFLVMDLLFHARRDLAEAFAGAYFNASGDQEGQALLPFYTSYRAIVRAKVEGIELTEKEIPEGEREAALVRARARWLLALGELEEPHRRPVLVLVGGLPGTGKSTLAHGLANKSGFTVIRSDAVRKELATAAEGHPPAGLDKGIYAPSWTERTYTECLRRVEHLLFEGRRVIVDATFREEEQRRRFLQVARRWGVPALMLLCEADPATARQRLEQRHGDASDADASVYRELAERWEEPGAATRQSVRVVDTTGIAEEALADALAALGEARLADAR
jgi:aminoglycoside phosphotransferase family enzyme/predicted kinase